MTQHMILTSTNHASLRFPGKDAFRVIQLVYQTEKKSLASVAVVNTNDRHIRKINKMYLQHDYVTDVIAFPLGSDGGIEGEIYLNLDAARRQAKEYGVTYSAEAARLLIHGLLHLLGYHDASSKQKENMHQREDFYLDLLKKRKVKK
jgi:probable rRNA maturation factor